MSNLRALIWCISEVCMSFSFQVIQAVEISCCVLYRHNYNVRMDIPVCMQRHLHPKKTKLHVGARHPLTTERQVSASLIVPSISINNQASPLIAASRVRSIDN